MTENKNQFSGRIGRTYRESSPSWSQPVRPRDGAPNVVFIVLDDVGFSDLGCYGAEINTPHMNKLATDGLRYNNFHVTAMCSPTRAALLTGRNAHTVGMGIISEWASGYPGYRGRITKRAATLAEVLRDHGYNTLAVGKWHLTPNAETTAAGPLDQWPCGRGFERWYGFHGSLADQWHPDLYEDNHIVEAPSDSQYHLSEDLTKRAIEFVRDQKTAAPTKPFFLYLAFGACHWPHHVPAEFIEKYRGRYSCGWDAIREERWQTQQSLGIIPKGTKLAPRNDGVDAWSTLTPDMQQLCARQQEVYAAFLEHTDAQIGRLTAYLEEIGEIKNTLIVLLSDNGASPEGGPFGALNLRKHLRYSPERPEYVLKNMDSLGSQYSLNHYATGWAQVSNTPLKWYKKDTHGGGIRAPLILHWPGGLKSGDIRSQYHHVIDIVPTVLEIVGASTPATYQGIEQLPVDGISMRYSFDSPETPTHRDSQLFELLGDRAIWKQGWKAVSRHKKGSDFDLDRWELYNLDEDFSECTDLAHAHPERLRALIDLWWHEASAGGVLPLDDREWERFAERKAGPQNNRYVFYPMMARIDRLSAPDIKDRAYHVKVSINIPNEGAEGVLLALGSRFGGYVLYIKDHHLIHEYVYTEHERHVVRSSRPVAPGSGTVGYRFKPTGANGGRGTLLINDEPAGDIDIPRMWPLSGIIGGLLCGRDAGSPLSAAYQCPFEFTGDLDHVVIELDGESQRQDASDFVATRASD